MNLGEKDPIFEDEKNHENEFTYGRSRKQDPEETAKGNWKRRGMMAGIVALGLLAGAGGLYAYKAQQYKTVFFPNTRINGLDASGKTIDEIKEIIELGMKDYALILETREGTTDQIAGRDIDLRAEYDGTLEEILSFQNPYKWGLQRLKESQHTIQTMMAYDEEKLEEELQKLPCLMLENTTPPKDAYLSPYIEGKGYQIVPEEAGNRLIYEVVLEGASQGILNLTPTLSLEPLGAYEAPRTISTDTVLIEQAKAWNRYTNVTVTYQFGSKTEILDGKTIHTWLSASETGDVVLDEAQVTAYVKKLGETYNTAYKKKTLKTSYGPTVTIDKGNYGWRINQGAESAALIEIIRSGEGQKREPIYSQTASLHDGADYGDTYVEMNLTAQHLYFYKDGKLLIESDFVSGNESKGWGTPSGAYPLTYKQRDATLKGEGYATPVSYWMPFNGGIGMHDATWRSSFGGNIYKTGGSHGCINLPPGVAKTIYENIGSGMPVLCYFLDGTGKGSTSITPPETKAPVQTSAAPPETTSPPQTSAPVATTPAPPETLPVETTPSIIPIETLPTPKETTASPSPGGGNPVGPGEGTTGKNTGAVAGPGM